MCELDWRWPFVANGGPGYSYLLEPIAQAIGQPYVSHPSALRDEDSSDFEFDDNNLFSADQLPGYDLIESGPRAPTSALRSEGYLSRAVRCDRPDRAKPCRAQLRSDFLPATPPAKKRQRFQTLSAKNHASSSRIWT